VIPGTTPPCLVREHMIGGCGAVNLQYNLVSAIVISDLSLTVEAGSHEIKFWRHSGGFDRFVHLLDDVLWYDSGVKELPYPLYLLVSGR
jgi:hypothetical protein